MLKSILIFLIIFSIHSNSHAQKILKFYQFYQQGSDFEKENKILEAEYAYENAFKIYKNDPDLNRDIISIYLRVRKVKKSIRAYKKGVLRGLNMDYLLADTIIAKKISTDSNWLKLYQVCRVAYNAKIQFQDERIELVRLLQKDQDVRNLMDLFSADKKDSIIRAGDIENMRDLFLMIKKIGLPDRDMVGEEAIGALYILLSHTLNDGDNDFADYNYIIPLLREAVLKGTFNNWWFANLVDRTNVIKEKKQIYGTYWEFSSTGKRILTAIENVGNVDSIRAEIGLPFLKVSLANLGLQLPDNYKP